MTRHFVGAHPRSRTLLHPGSFNPVRIRSEAAAHGRHFRLLLQPGVSLHDGLVLPLAELHIASASCTLLGGGMSALEYCVAPPDPEKKSVIAYGPAIDAGPAYLVFGNATLGESLQGRPLVHCHGVIRDRDGAVRGGHILTESCIVGAAPIPVLVTAFDGFALRQVYDPETNIPLLQPFREAPHA